ncbi:MH2 domain-containing protein, partial [Trichostrongylus colubriformis]
SSPEYEMAFSPSSMLSEEDGARMEQVSPYTTPPTQYWATISYYELNSRVGEYFKVGQIIKILRDL